VTHRRAGKTVACIEELHRAATACPSLRPRFAYLAPFLRQSKAVAWDYLRAAIARGRAVGASAHEGELRVDYPNGGQVRLYGADNPDAMRGIYLDGIVLDEYADMDPRVWSEIIRPALADRRGWAVFIGTLGFFSACMFLFLRLLPAVSISELKTLLPEAEVTVEHEAEVHH